MVGSSYLSLVDALAGLGDAAARQGKKIWLLFDGINEFNDLDAHPADLLRRLDNLIARLVATMENTASIKIVVTCRLHSWRLMESMGDTGLRWEHYHAGQPVHLGEFSQDELRRAYQRYGREFPLPIPFEALSESARSHCRNPLLLRLMFEICQEQPALLDGTEAALFDAYYQRMACRPDDQRFAGALAARLAERQIMGLPLSALNMDPALNWGLSNDPEGPYQRLQAAGILMESGPSHLRKVSFTYDRLLEYLLAVHFLGQHEAGLLGDDFLIDLCRRSAEFPPYWGAALTILTLSPQPEDFSRLAGSESDPARRLAVEGLLALYRNHPSSALKTARGILDLGSLNAKRVALEAASQIGAEGYTIFRAGAGAKDELTNRATLAFLYSLWHRQPHSVLEILAQLVDEVTPLTVLRSPRLIRTILRILGWFIHYNLSPAETDRVDELVYRLAVSRLHLPKARSSGRLMGLVQGILSLNTTSWPASSKMLDAIYRAGSLADPEKSAFRWVLDTLRMGEAGLERVPISDILTLLNTGLEAAILLAQHQLAVWLHLRPGDALPAIQSLFAQVDHTARLWLLFAFLPLSAPTAASRPDALLPVLEEFTACLLAEGPASFEQTFPRELGIPQRVIPLLPLGLRYAEVGRLEFPLVRSLIDSVRQQPEAVAAYLRLLAPVGWYHPQPVLKIIAAHTNIQCQLPKPFIEALAMIWVLHAQAVENMMQRLGANDLLIRLVRMAADIEGVAHCIGNVNTNDLRVSSIIRGAPYGRWVTDSVLAGYLECSSLEDASRRFGAGLLEIFIENNWQVKKVLGLD